MQFLSFRASSERHINWALDILTSMGAHQSQNQHLSEQQKKVLEREAGLVRQIVDQLQAAVDERDIKLSAKLRELRAQRRVADYVCDSAVREVDGRLRPHREEIGLFLPGGFSGLFQGISLYRVLNSGAERTAGLLLAAATTLDDLPHEKFPFAPELASSLRAAGSQLRALNEEYNDTNSQRLTFSNRLHRGEVELREALQQMNGRLRSDFPQAFIESLYPILSSNNRSKGQESIEDEDSLGDSLEDAS